MKRVLIVIVILVIFGAVALALLSRTDRSAGASPSIAGAPASAAAVARGEYLLKAADCVACHTAGESGKPFAGGVAFKLPFGTIYSSNITPDPTYGIGAYTDDEFVRAVREGVRRDVSLDAAAGRATQSCERARISVQSAIRNAVLEGGFPQERPL
jgi:mono/diheme cytochrome c family protein